MRRWRNRRGCGRGNQYIYLYYTFNKFNACPLSQSSNPNNPVNRVSRFSLLETNLILTSSEVVILDNIPQPVGAHNGGDLHFGADGWLYVSTGDGGVSSNARTLENLAGKILRLAADGAIPPDNPYVASAGSRRCGEAGTEPTGSGPCQEIFAHGLRNPFRLAFGPGTNDFYINDVGNSFWEEIDQGAAGADYGWPVRDGAVPTGRAELCSGR